MRLWFVTSRPVLAVLAAITAAVPALALEPEQREVTVVSGRVWEGHEYREIFVPSTKDEMTLIAGRDSAVAFVRTLEYYWPLSRQVYVDFERQRDLVEGEMVVRLDGREIAREHLQPFSVHYREGAARGGGELLWGREAEQAHAAYREAERKFAREFAAARRAHTAYEQQLLESGAAARQAGEQAPVIEPPPPLPEPSLRLVTEPEPGFRLSLEPGAYSIALEHDGQAVPGTKRRLRVVNPSRTSVVVVDVVPSERWTRPLAANTPAARIYARPGAVFYLTLTEADRYAEADYLPVVSPQSEPAGGRSIWVRRHPARLDRLGIDWQGGEDDALVRRALKVEQTRGSSFGYRVRVAREGESADLDAFTVAVPTDASISRGLISHEERSLGREVVVVQPRRAARGLVLALLPLVGFLTFLGIRKRRSRR